MKVEFESQQFPVADLHCHPQQDTIFSDMSDSALQELADDMQQRGQQEAVHCLADGTLISGHQRVRAARSLGWDTVTAIVRHDLGDADSPAAVEHLIQANLQRRQLDDLAIARCYRELKQIELEGGPTRGSGKLRDRIAARMPGSQSGRTLDRLERLLELPRDIQDMVSAGKLTKADAAMILKLAPDDQQAAYKDLRGGRTAKAILIKLGVMRPSTRPSTTEKAEDLMGFLADNLDELREQTEFLDQLQVSGADVLDVLNRAVTFFPEWRDRKSVLAERSVQEMGAMIGRHGRRIEARLPTDEAIG